MRWVQCHPLLTVLLVAGSLRLTAACGVQWYLDNVAHTQFLIAGDADGYWRLAETIRNGEPYAVYDPPRRVLRMPGFPAILAGGMTLGNGNPLVVRIVLAGIGTLACGLTYGLGRELANPTVGLLAGLYAALSPLQVGFSVLILSETAFAVPMLASLWATAVFLRTDLRTHLTRGLLLAAVVGSSIGLAVLIRPLWLPMVGVFGLVCLIVNRFRLRSWLAYCALAGCTMLLLWPWNNRNWHITGQPVMTTLWSGPSLYDGLNPNATGASDMRFMEEDGLLTKLDETSLNRHYWNAAWLYARNNPGRSIQLAFVKIGRLWSPWLNASEANRWFVQVPIVIAYLVLIGGAAAGIWIERRNLLLLGITLAPAILTTGVHSLFVGSVRYRLPIEFPLAVLAAVGIQHICCNRQPRTTEAFA